MKKILGLMVFVAGVCFGAGSVTVYNASGGFVGSYTTIQEGIKPVQIKGLFLVKMGYIQEQAIKT